MRAPALAAYVPVDISAEFLRERGRGAAARLPALAVLPVAADFTQPFALPAAIAQRRAPASSRARPSAISSRTRPAAFLRHAGRILGAGRDAASSASTCVKDRARAQRGL